MKIAFFELEDWQKEEMKKTLENHELFFVDSPLSEKNVNEIKDSEVISFFIYSKATKEIISQLPKLKLITTMSTGFDHIDLDYCKQKNITVCNVPVYGENTVAEHAFALILALSRKLYPSIKRTHEQHSFETDITLRGFDLKEKTLGIVGGGNIGKHVARIAKGYEMNVLVFDLHQNEEVAKKIGFKYATFDELLANSDIITLHVPYNTHTHYLINEEAIQKMKKGVYIINTARGGIIDTPSLVKALQDKKVAGAGLDVLEKESEIKEEMALLKKEFKESHNLKTILEDHILMKMDNVIITPHNAFNSREALQRIIDTTIENIKNYIQGNPKNEVR